ELLTRLLQRLEKPIHLGRHFFFPDRHPKDLSLAPLNDHRASDGDAGRGADALIRANIVSRRRSEFRGPVGEHKRLPVAGSRLPEAFLPGHRQLETGNFASHSTSSNLASISFSIPSTACR